MKKLLIGCSIGLLALVLGASFGPTILPSNWYASGTTNSYVIGGFSADNGAVTNAFKAAAYSQGSTPILTAGQHLTNISTASIGTNYVGQLITTNGPVINVLAYGADPTGVADSTVAFTNAIWQSRQSNGTNQVFIPAGLYTITNVLDLLTFTNSDASFAGAVHIEGAGARLTTLFFKGDTNGFQAIGADSQGWIGPTIKGMTLLADNAPSNTNTMDAIHFENVQMARIEDVNIAHWRYSAVYWTNVWVSTLRNVYCLSNGGPGHAVVEMSHCYENRWDHPDILGFHTNQLAAVALDTCIGLTVTGGDITGSGHSPLILMQEVVPSDQYCQGVIFLGTQLEAPSDFYIKMGSANTNLFTPGIRDCGFYCVNGTASGATNIFGGVITTNACNVTFDRCQFDITGQPATNVFNFQGGTVMGGMSINPSFFFSLATNFNYVATNSVKDGMASITRPYYQTPVTGPGNYASPFIVGDGTGSADIFLDRSTNNVNGMFSIETAGNLRWNFGTRGTDLLSSIPFYFDAYNGSTYLGTPIEIDPSTMYVTNYNLAVATNFVANGTVFQGATPVLKQGGLLTNLVSLASSTAVAQVLSGTNTAHIGGVTASTLNVTNANTAGWSNWAGIFDGTTKYVGGDAALHNLPGGGNVTAGALTTGTIPKASGATAIADGPMQVGSVTNIALTGGLTADNAKFSNNVDAATISLSGNAILAYGSGAVNGSGTWVVSTINPAAANIGTETLTNLPTWPSQTQNRVWASPNGSSGAPTMRALVAGDIPSLSYVSSVGLSAPSGFSVSGSPVTSSGTLALSYANWASNQFLAGPINGGSATAPTLRRLDVTDFNGGASASSSTFWAGDGTWKTPAGAGNMFNTGASIAKALPEYTDTTGTAIDPSKLTVTSLTNLNVGSIVLSNATASRVIMKGADNINTNVSGAGILNGDGSATTAAQIVSTLSTTPVVHAKLTKYLYIGQGWNRLSGTGCVLVNTNDVTAVHFMVPQFSGDATTGVTNQNFVRFVLAVPADIDTSVDLTATLKFELGGADTAAHTYHIGMVSVADSAAADATAANYVTLSFAGDASGASGDIETIGPTTLTGWKSAVTAGQYWVIQLDRLGSDTSTVNSWLRELVIAYGSTQ